jgi:hypothetical protein
MQTRFEAQLVLCSEYPLLLLLFVRSRSLAQAARQRESATPVPAQQLYCRR